MQHKWCCSVKKNKNYAPAVFYKLGGEHAGGLPPSPHSIDESGINMVCQKCGKNTQVNMQGICEECESKTMIIFGRIK